MAASTEFAVDASVAFIENRIDGVLVPPAIGNELYFNRQKDRFTEFNNATLPNDIYAVADEEIKKVNQAISEFQKSADKKNSTKGSSTEPKKRYIWQDVEQTMEDERKNYEAKHEGKVPHGLQVFCTSIGNYGGIFSTWLSLLPNDTYTSILCGTFNIIIKAATRATKIRDTVFHALSRIPEVLDNAKEYLTLNNLHRSLKLEYAFARLYTAILVAFEEMLGWLSKSSWRHAGGAVFKGENYGKSIELKVTSVEEHATHVKEQAAICSQYVIGRIDQNVSEQILQLDGVTVTLKGVKNDVEGLEGMLKNLGTYQETISNNVIQIKDVLNGFHKLLKSDARKTLFAQELQKAHLRREEHNYEKILSQLNCDTAVVERDIERAITVGKAFQREEQERTEFFIDAERLKLWMTNEDSEVLLVNGNHSSDKISPLTFACGILAKSLSSYPGALRLCFYCGMHCDSQAEDVGAGLMVASLVSQLLTSYGNYNMKFLKTWRFKPRHLKADNPKRIEALLGLFSELVVQLPQGQVVFCVIDGIQFYETHTREEDTYAVMMHLIDLIHDQNEQERNRIVFKLLITSPARSTGLWKRIPRENIWQMPSVITGSGQSFNTKRQLEKKEREVKEMENARGVRNHSEDDWSYGDSDDEEDDDEMGTEKMGED